MNFQPLLLGHRGVRPLRRFRLPHPDSLPRENTIAAFEYALAHGCDGFEFDVRTTRDGRNILWHDPKLHGLEISSASFDELRARSEVEPACLEDALLLFADRAYFDIEVKAPGDEEAIVAAVRSHPPNRGYVVSSFLGPVLRRLHAIDASLPLGYICDRTEDLSLWRELPIRVLIPQYKLVSQNLISDVHDRGLQLFTWTVNRKPDLVRLADWGIDAVISDDPALLSRTFRARSRSNSE